MIERELPGIPLDPLPSPQRRAEGRPEREQRPERREARSLAWRRHAPSRDELEELSEAIGYMRHRAVEGREHLTLALTVNTNGVLYITTAAPGMPLVGKSERRARR